jgi:hypothetical protein
MNQLLNLVRFASQGKTPETVLENTRIYLIALNRFLKSNNFTNGINKHLDSYGTYIPELSDRSKEILNKLFESPDFFKDSLLSVYPKFGTIKGKFYPLITGDLDKLFEDYAKKIGYSIDTHKEVLEIVQWAKDKELLNIGIEKFILSYYWESLKELMNKDSVFSDMVAQDF